MLRRLIHMTHDKQADNWQPIATMKDWLELESKVSGFHDGVIKEMHWSHGEHVNLTFEMVYAGNPRLWILIQLQFAKTPGIEIRFSGVRECSINAVKEVEPSVSFQTNLIVFSFSGDGISRVIADACEYRLCGSEILGPGPFHVPL